MKKREVYVILHICGLCRLQRIKLLPIPLTVMCRIIVIIVLIAWIERLRPHGGETVFYLLFTQTVLARTECPNEQ